MQNLPFDYCHHYNQTSLWGKDYHPVNVNRANEIIAMIPEDVTSILDAGCGDGLVTNRLDRQYFSVGLDISMEALKYLTVPTLCTNITTIPFKDDSFDIVLANELIEHLPVPIYEKSLGEIQRVAKKYILLSVPYDEFLELSFARCPACGCIFHGARHVRRFTPDNLRNLLRDFSLKETKTIGTNHEKATRLEIFIRQNMGGDYYYYSDATVCPLCSTVIHKRPQRGICSYMAAFLRRVYGMFVKEKPSWILALYEKSN